MLPLCAGLLCLATRSRKAWERLNLLLPVLLVPLALKVGADVLAHGSVSAEAPVPTATLLGAAFVNCAVYGIARFHVLAVKSLGPEFPGQLLAGFSVASILVAAPFILTQRNFRRVLAYSSIDQAGIMVAALGFGGKLGALGAALHMLFHGVTKPLMFFCAGNVQQHSLYEVVLQSARILGGNP